MITDERAPRPVSRKQEAAADFLMLAAVLGLPLLGALAGGRSVAEFVQFPPPLRIPRDYVHFSWAAESAVALALGMVVAPWLARLAGDRRMRSVAPAAHVRRFPVWGGIALAWTGLWWTLAWTRLAWFAPLQRFTFFPLWLGFIVAVNALIERRGGHSLMRRAPRRWLGLFLVSAGFWWIFEWLNRFVQNWHYLGVEDFGPGAYAANASLCFSTVLPAVAAVAELLATSAGWRRRVAGGPKWRGLTGRGAGLALVTGGVVALGFTGRWPRTCYPALWIAPLALSLGRDALRNRGLAAEVARGDWTRAATWMVAALICGGFWELWNGYSLAKWIYTVPGVERWRVFEMPLAGYVGYLPFGLECVYVATRVTGRIPAPE